MAWRFRSGRGSLRRRAITACELLAAPALCARGKRPDLQGPWTSPCSSGQTRRFSAPSTVWSSATLYRLDTRLRRVWQAKGACSGADVRTRVPPALQRVRGGQQRRVRAGRARAAAHDHGGRGRAEGVTGVPRPEPWRGRQPAPASAVGVAAAPDAMQPGQPRRTGGTSTGLQRGARKTSLSDTRASTSPPA